MLDSVVDLVGVGCKRDRQFRPVAKLDEEELVLRIGRLEECGGRLSGLLDLVSHAAAVVEQQADRQGRVFEREIRDGLFYAVFKDLEIRFMQIRDGRAKDIRYLSRHQHQCRIDADIGFGENGLATRSRWPETGNN